MPKRFSLIKPHYNALKLLSKAKKGHYKIIIDNTPSLPQIIKHLAKYILNGTIKLERKHVMKLKPHKKLIRKLSSGSKTTIKAAVQKGGSIFQTILKTILPLLPTLML